MGKKEAPIADVRIIGVFAHVDAGKTTTSEAILYFTGRTHRLGAVDSGDTQLDWMDQERERGITITAAATACHWQGHRINLIDTPGHIDFTAEVVRSIRVIDGGVVILCAVGGVEPQTEAVWMHGDSENLPRMLFVNKLDRSGADFDRVLSDARDRLTANAVPLQIPIGREGNFRGVVDLLSQQALIWPAGSEDPQVEPIPAEMESAAQAAREKLIDAICETDEVLLGQCLEGDEPSPDELLAALRRATIASKLVPVLCGASRHRIGVQPLLDAIVAYLPSPEDLPPILGFLPGDEEEIIERDDDPTSPLCAAAFKIVTDPHVGHLTWVRVFSGSLDAGEMVLNARTGEKERVSRIYRIHGNHREQVGSLAASDVVALVGVKSAITGDTLCDPDHPIMLETFKFPDPVITIALTPASTDQREKLHNAVQRLCAEDPTLISQSIVETGELTLSGMGELHLEVAVERLRREFHIRPAVSPPQVSYRETVRRMAETTGRYKKQSGGRGHFGEVELRVEPLERGEGLVFVDESPPSELPREFVRPVETGVRGALEKGVIAGFPLTDVRVTLLGGRFHEVDSASMDFEIAGSMGVREAVMLANPGLIEPVMSIDMNVDEQYLGVVVGDLSRRRGEVKEMRVRGHVRTVEGRVPLAETFGYATALRSLTSGRGTFSLTFDSYEPLPQALAEEVIKQRKEEGKLRKR